MLLVLFDFYETVTLNNKKMELFYKIFESLLKTPEKSCFRNFLKKYVVFQKSFENSCKHDLKSYDELPNDRYKTESFIAF